MPQLAQKKLQNDFQPAWWASSAHLQTILSALFTPSKSYPLARERFELPDGDFLDGDYLEGDPLKPYVLLLPGLEGSSNSHYIRLMLSALSGKRWNALALNMRGCSGEPNRLPSSYHAGKTEDLDFIIHLLRERLSSPLFVVGYSLGGNVLLKWLGEKGSAASSLLEKAVAVSVPYDLTQSVRLLDRGFNQQVYTRSMLRSLKQKTALKKDKLSVSYEQVLKCSTFDFFDEHVTAKLNGFESAKAYWRESSSKYYLQKIKSPVLLVHAKDDPFFPDAYFPYQEIEKAPSLECLITERGGHLGFLCSRFLGMRKQWLEEKIVDFFTLD